jgi:hypothetical protein
MEPPRPAVAVPDPISTSPECPVTDVPVLNFKAPLAPAVPALVVLIETIPLVVAVPSPETQNKLPPVLAALTAPLN